MINDSDGSPEDDRAAAESYLALRDLHHRGRVCEGDPHQLRHRDVQRLLDQITASSTGNPPAKQVALRVLGESYEGRSVRLASIGSGATQVLMWTQMHGDEPTHTAVALDLLNLLTQHSHGRIDPLLDRCTLHVLPMLNPDGVERWTRANAQGVDINRDAVALESPEARLLRNVVLQIDPQYAFNLHNQLATKRVSGTNGVASVSVLAPPLPPQAAMTPSFLRAKQLATRMFDVAELLAPGHVSRYEAEYMPTAFGEWVQGQGVATALLEAGGMPSGRSEDGVQLHFVVLLSALLSIADDGLEKLNVARYDSLPLNIISQQERT